MADYKGFVIIQDKSKERHVVKRIEDYIYLGKDTNYE